MRDKALIKAIKIVGGKARLAKIIGISREAVGQWERCPTGRVWEVSEATNGQVTPEMLRPDIFRRGAASSSSSVREGR